MLAGYIEKISPDRVHGWAADISDPDAVVEVAIYIEGRRVARVACSDLRADLRDAGRYGDGRHGFYYTFSPDLTPVAAERVTVRFASTGAIVPNGEAELSRWQPLTPILITAPGRSGTTLLMSRLARSPQIVVGEMHPFEVRQIAYWSTVVATLSGPADFDRATHPDRLEGDGFRIGANPFSHPDYTELFRNRALEAEYFQGYVPGQLRDLARTMILEYYLRIRDDRQKLGAAFFAEKNNNLEARTREFTRALFADLKEIILIRDLRDLLCSQHSYFRREPDLVLREITEASHELLRLKHDESDRLIFVRYEDLILDGGTALARLAGYLGVDKFQALDNAGEKSTFEAHGTSASPKASIGRWKSQLSEEQRSLCLANWELFLAEFGYS